MLVQKDILNVWQTKRARHLAAFSQDTLQHYPAMWVTLFPGRSRSVRVSNQSSLLLTFNVRPNFMVE
jgi:hypothetical protein